MSAPVERTSLSWTRTALAAATLAGVAFKDGIGRGDAAGLVVGALATAAAGVLAACGRLRATVAARGGPGAASALVGLTAVVVLAASGAAAGWLLVVAS